MPRKLKPSDVQALRARNYAFHYDERQYFVSLPEDVRVRLAELSRLVPCPPLSLMGSDDLQSEIWKHLIKLGAAHGFDYRLSAYIHPWVQDEGWEIYKAMFQSLPEPVEFVHIPVDNWPVVHSQSADFVHTPVGN